MKHEYFAKTIQIDRNKRHEIYLNALAKNNIESRIRDDKSEESDDYGSYDSLSEDIVFDGRRRSKFDKKIGKHAAKSCSDAHKIALDRLCKKKYLDCTKLLHKSFNKESRKSCKKQFISGKYSDNDL